MKLIYLSIILFLVTSCAQVVSLTGGSKDVFAPTIDSAKTFPLNGTTNFSGQSIQIKFDEYIKLKNPTENIIITPQLKESPDFWSKNKTFKLTFNEPLLENTTYVINFNGAIQDITESNDSIFQYVFSTGDYIDSLSISGMVSDAQTNKPIEKALIGVYPTQDLNGITYDSIPYLVKPTYLTQTNKKGQYTVNYLKAGTYYIFALTDANKNLLLDVETEQIGFFPNEIKLKESVDSVDFKTFFVQPSETKIKDVKFEYPGKIEIIFNQPFDQFSLKTDFELLEAPTPKQDSVIYWLTAPPKQGLKFIGQINNGDLDTLSPFYKAEPNSYLFKSTHNIKSGKINPNENLTFTFNEPIKMVDTSRVIFLDSDSNMVKVDYTLNHLTELVFNTLNSTATFVLLDSGAVTSIYDHVNQTVVKMPFETRMAEDYFGTLVLKFTAPKNQYVLELMDKKNKVLNSYIISDKDSTMTIENLAPGSYYLRLIEDKNKDGQWTTGDLLTATQPERIYYYSEQVKIRSKWKKEIQWIINE